MKWVAKILILFFALIIIIPYDLGSEDIASKDVKKTQKELDKLNKSINDTRKKLKNLNNKEKTTLKTIQKHQKHSLEVNRFINLLEAQLNELQKEITIRDSMYYGLSNKLSILLREYAELARQVYVEGLTEESEVIFSRKSFDNDTKDEIYFAYLTKYLDSQAKSIDLMRIKVSNEIGQLRDKSDYQEELKGIKRREQSYLAQSINNNKNMLSKIKNDTKVLQKQLNQKMQSASKLKSIIAELIRKEAAKPEKTTPNSSAKINPAGQYPWPVDGRTIFRGYGQQKNKATDTYFDNPGIDIAVRSGSTVRNIEVGEVSMVHWLPGYGTLVIMNHGNGLRSVYANLSSVSVRKGDRVNKGAMIGRTGESVEGEFLHFELWQGSNRLNPRSHLR